MSKFISALTVFSVVLLTACSGGSGGSGGDASGVTKVASEKRVLIVPPTGAAASYDPSELWTLISTTDNFSGTCSTGTSRSNCYINYASGTTSTLEDGTTVVTIPAKTLGGVSQTYSGYAAIRNEVTYKVTQKTDGSNAYERVDESATPIVNYMGLVTEPTTSKNLVVDATYTGRVSYSTKNSGAVVSNRDITLTVADKQISGYVTSTTGSGTVNRYIYFQPTEIEEVNGQVSFSGDMLISERIFNTNLSSTDYASDTTFLDEKKSNGTAVAAIKGSYTGMFAGANAEEAVGTFHSANTGKENSVQGAFAVKK